MGTPYSVGSEVPLARGAFTVSIDLELLWGVWDHVHAADAEACRRLEREIVSRLLALFRSHELPATWAVVARLLDDRRGFDGLRGAPSCWYAPDLVEAVRADVVDHEIATHSFGHIYFGESDAAAVRADLEAARDVHAAHGLPFRSLVFPRNQVAHLDIVADVGIKVIRTQDAGALQAVSRIAPRLRPVVNLGDKALPTAPPVVLPVHREHGLVELPSSLLLLGRNGVRRVVTPASMRAKLRAGLHRAVDEARLFHLWFHPSNFYTDLDGQLALLDGVLAEAAALVRQGRLDVLPMGAFVSQGTAAA